MREKQADGKTNLSVLCTILDDSSLIQEARGMHPKGMEEQYWPFRTCHMQRKAGVGSEQ